MTCEPDITPPRGFPTQEYLDRLSRAQALMAKADLSGLLLTTEPDLRYFTGFLTRFWESPTRPWYLLVPQSGEPVAVIPSIGAALMRQTWVTDIRTWSAPDLQDDGVGLLAQSVQEISGATGRIGIPSGHETHLRMPLADYARLGQLLGADRLDTDHGILRQLRMIKSDLEVAKIAQACAIAGRAFARVPQIAQADVPLDQVFRQFQMLCLEEGADWVPYLAGGAGPDGYADVISPAQATLLRDGEVMMLDTGLVWDGYFCDFDRNFAVTAATPAAQAAHTRLFEATQAGFEAARPGATAADVFHAMDRIVTGGAGGSEAGRLGHGLGMQLTEWPSFIAGDHTVIQPGMVLTLEPGIDTGEGSIMVHEENIVITEKETIFLSPLAPSELPVI